MRHKFWYVFTFLSIGIAGSLCNNVYANTGVKTEIEGAIEINESEKSGLIEIDETKEEVKETKEDNKKENKEEKKEDKEDKEEDKKTVVVEAGPGESLVQREKIVENKFVWTGDQSNKNKQISGLRIAGSPAELFMLSIAGESSGGTNEKALTGGDNGRAYGFCQFDYRYDLVGFMNWAYNKNPGLWAGFSNVRYYEIGDQALVNNETIAKTFLEAKELDYETFISDQLEYAKIRYWNTLEKKLNNAGFNLGGRHIAVSAALFSVSINCGSQPSIFIDNINPEGMSDAEMICCIYDLRNTIFANQIVKGVLKGTTRRYQKTEPKMALDLLHGYCTIDSNRNYGAGVRWKGNLFSDSVSTTIIAGNSTEWDEYESQYTVVQPQASTDGPVGPGVPGTDNSSDSVRVIGPGVTMSQTNTVIMPEFF